MQMSIRLHTHIHIAYIFIFNIYIPVCQGIRMYECERKIKPGE